MSWYVRADQDAQPQGPFTVEKMKSYIAHGRVRSDMWFSRDGAHWTQNPVSLFPAASAPAAPASASPAKRGPGAPEGNDDEPPRTQRPTKRSPAPWLFALVTVLLLLFALFLDQWATTRVSDKNAQRQQTVALHYGRNEMAIAVEVIGNERGIKVQTLPYDKVPGDSIRKTILYGNLLLWLTLVAVVLRLTGSYLVWQRGRFVGGGSSVYILATVMTSAVVVVAYLFNDGGLLGSLSDSFGSSASATHGYGGSAWIVLVAAVMDAFGILGVKAAMTPRRRPAPRGRRR